MLNMMTSFSFSCYWVDHKSIMTRKKKIWQVWAKVHMNNPHSLTIKWYKFIYTYIKKNNYKTKEGWRGGGEAFSVLYAPEWPTHIQGFHLDIWNLYINVHWWLYAIALPLIYENENTEIHFK